MSELEGMAEIQVGDRIATTRSLHFHEFYPKGSTGVVQNITQDLMTITFDKDGLNGPVFRQEATLVFLFDSAKIARRTQSEGDFVEQPKTD